MARAASLFERFVAENRAGGIVGRIEDQDAGARRDFRFDFGDVGLKFIFLFEKKWNGLAPRPRVNDG